ncbi:MAG TPA: hypothetical protein PK335_05720 [Draconibacterium sp.]|nr:hypothetical protein [Draconibacterium sp.]
MRIADWLDKEEVAKKYPIFKGYPVKMKEKVSRAEDDYVVPWAMPHEERKNKKN